MLERPFFSVILINYNSGPYISRALQSLKDQSFRDFEVIIMDNGSDDGSAEFDDLTGLPDVEVVKLGENLGFAAANNLAAERARGKWLALLNPDTIACPNWLQELAAASARYPSCRSFASAQYRLGNRGELDGAGDAYHVFGFPWRGGFGHSSSELPEEGYCFSACGAAAMYDRELFLAYNGFDERFFCYCEDVDLGFRLRIGGESCIFVPSAVIDHEGSGISGRTSAFSLYHGTRNRLWTFAKCMPLGLKLALFPIHLGLSLYVLIRHLVVHKEAAGWRGLMDGLKGLPALSQTKRWDPPRRKVSIRELTQSMAWNPVRLSQRKPHVQPLDVAENVILTA